ncbi:hypothetical protein CR513_14444, partial [Mucuna pruriens]
MEIMFLLLDLTTSNFTPLYLYTMNLQRGGQLELLKSRVTTPIRKNCLIVNGQPQKLEQLLKFDFIINILDIHCLMSVESLKCDICQFLKHHRATFSSSNNKSLEPFDLIHSDVWGPASNSISGAKWFVSFIDDCTRVTWIFLMKQKYKIYQIFVDFFRLVKNQFNKSIKRLQSDNGTEFVNLEFSKFLKDNERKNRHLLEVARALLFQMYVPKVYWGEAVLTGTYLINRLFTRVLNSISPIKHMLSFFSSSLLMLNLLSCVFGCVAFVHSYNPHRRKLDPRAVKCVFIDYPLNKKGFKCYHPSSRRFFVSMDVTFHETQSFFVCPPLQGGVSIPDNSIEDVTDNMPITLRKGKQSCVKYLISQFVCTDHLSVQHQSFIVVIDAIKTPTSVQEALKDENWVQVMKEEMEALEKNSTWEIVNRLKDERVIGCRWIYIVKCKSDGTLERYKERLVAEGYTQTYGINYEETFTPVAKMNTFDVKNVFLDGYLEEEVYMEIPPGFCSHSEKNKVCRLKNALYGLKQFPRAWFGRFSHVMISLGYRQSQGDDKIEKLNLKEKLATQFEMKELRKLKYFLGIEVAYSKQGIFISQRKYELDLLKETGKLECKITRVLIEKNHKIVCEEIPIIEKLVEKLIYLSHTRSDIAYAVSVVVERILQYLKASPGKGLLFKKEGTLSMEIYTDVDYAGSVVDRRSTSRYCMFLGGNLVTWRSKKQNVVARSSAEAEF